MFNFGLKSFVDHGYAYAFEFVQGDGWGTKIVWIRKRDWKVI